MTQSESTISSAGVVCPRCGKIHAERADLDTLIPEQPTEWGCENCGAKMAATKLLARPSYTAKLIEDLP